MTTNSYTHLFRTNIGVRIFSFLAVGLIVASIGLNYFFYNLQEKNLKEELFSRGKSLATLLADNVKPGVFSGSTTLLEASVKSLASQPGIVWIYVFDKYSTPLFTEKNPQFSKFRAPYPNLKKPLNSKVSSSYIESSTTIIFEEPVVVSISTAPEEDLFFENGAETFEQNIGYIQICLSKKQLQNRKKSLLVQTIITCLSFLALLLPLAYFIIRQSTKPLRALLLNIRQQLHKEDKTSSDVDLLNRRFNSMISELEESFSTINSLKENLETQVKERTSELRVSNIDLKQTLHDLQETQVQLIHSEKMASLGLLSTGLAHEINNALTIVQGSMGPLKHIISQHSSSDSSSTDFNDKTVEKKLETIFLHIDDGVLRITSLIRDLMTFARPGTGAKRLIDINSEIDITLRLLNIENHESIEITKDFKKVCPILCHGSQIAQVLFNILLNALQALEKEGGTLSITTCEVGDKVTLAIRDNGSGIQPDALPKVFDPFFTTKEVGKGTGLGLGICHSIILAHKGEIRIESEVGCGTTVFIILPVFSPQLSTPSLVAKSLN